MNVGQMQDMLEGFDRRSEIEVIIEELEAGDQDGEAVVRIAKVKDAIGGEIRNGVEICEIHTVL